MPKVRVLSRSETAHTRETRHDVLRVQRNLDPALHPFERAREYTRAVQASKLERMFAKPFVGALEGHRDGVWCTAQNKRSLLQFLSGGCDGEVRLWDLPSRRTVWSVVAHQGFVRGVCMDQHGDSFFTCGDSTVKQWPVGVGSAPGDQAVEPLRTFVAPHGTVLGMDHHWGHGTFATAGDSLCIWAHERAEPVQTFDRATDGLLSCKFNPAEPDLIATTANDRAICLFDLRAGGHAVRELTLAMKSNCLAWNPREPFNFTVANEDHNLYSFDMRRLERATLVHMDHVSAVMSVCYSSTGTEFVSGSYDKTVRIFNARQGRSRDQYHTRRMQRVFCVNYTADGKYVVSGSDDTNLRLWKAQASKTVGVRSHRRRRKEDYDDRLKERFAHMPEVRQIQRSKPVPKHVRKMARTEREQRDAQRRKSERRVAAGATDEARVPAREQPIVRERS